LWFIKLGRPVFTTGLTKRRVARKYTGTMASAASNSASAACSAKARSIPVVDIAVVKWASYLADA
jgi:hypothetical protein